MKSLLWPLLFAVLLVGCASSNPNDPYESFNRPMFRINKAVDGAIFKPVAQGYRYVTPNPFRRAIGNFFDNFRDVYSIGSNLLSLKPEASLNDLMRVAMNSTFGIAGLIDVADPAGLKNNKNTFGDTMANWGWKKSNYLVLPLLGPSTVRDSISTVVGLAASPNGWLYHSATQKFIGATVGVINTRERLLDVTSSIDDAALDEYSYTRDGFMQLRNKQVGLEPIVTKDDDVNIDDLITPPDNKQPPSNKISDKSRSSGSL